MKTICFVFVCASAVFLQANDLRPKIRQNSPAAFGGMGVQLVIAPDVVDYINAVTTTARAIRPSGANIDFFGGVEIPVSEEWGMKLEHSYSFASYSVPGKFGGTYDFFYSVQSPSLILQRIITGNGYFVKIGAGGGYHFGSAEQTVSTFGQTTLYTTQGAGFKGEIVGQTAFDNSTYAYIGAAAGWEILGTLKDSSGRALTIPNASTTVALNQFFAGIRFGITYYL